MTMPNNYLYNGVRGLNLLNLNAQAGVAVGTSTMGGGQNWVGQAGA